MKKRSRRERRESAAARALQAGDPSALEAQIQQKPEQAARRFLRALAARPSDPAAAAALDAGAARFAKRLRLSGKVALALEVAAAGERRTAALRMEEALAAFALGGDAMATAIALQDERVDAVLRPLLFAARGDAPLLEGAEDPPELRALTQAAGAVALAVRGEPREARARLQRIAPPLRPMVLATELEAALDLGSPEWAENAVAWLSRSLGGRSSRELRELREAIVAEVYAQDHEPKLEARLMQFPGMTPEEIQRTRRLTLHRRLAAASSATAAASLLRNVDPAMFPPFAQAAASLYRGFGLLRDEPDAAVRWFERAITQGGDLLEALRGKLIATLVLAADASPRAGRQRSASRLAACTAERLAKALGCEPRGRMFAAFAATLAADAWLRARDVRSAEASIRQARAFGATGLAIELAEIEVLKKRDPAAALARVDALLAEDRTQVRVWGLKLAFAEEEEEVEAILVEAAEATGHPMFAEMLAELEAEREEMALSEMLALLGSSARAAARMERGGGAR